MTSTRKRLTLDEFLRLPEQKPALEFAEGEITQKVAPQGQHSGIQGDLVEIVNRRIRRRKLGRAFPELRTTYAGHSLVPDVAVYTWDRIAVTESGRLANQFTSPPEVAFEIVSPEQSVTTLIRKCIWYVENGVKVAVIVDPEDSSVIVYRPDADSRVLHGDETIDLADVIPGLRLTLKEVFGALRVR